MEGRTRMRMDDYSDIEKSLTETWKEIDKIEKSYDDFQSEFFKEHKYRISCLRVKVEDMIKICRNNQ